MRLRTLLLALLLAALVLPAAGLTAVRAVQPGGEVAVRAASFAPLALPLYVLAILAVLLRAWASRGTGQRRWRWFTLLLVVAVGVHGWWLAPQFAGDAPNADEASQSFSVMTLNLDKGAADPPRVVETAAEGGAEVLVLQEVTPAGLRQLERYGIGEAYPYRAGRPAPESSGTMVFSVFRLAEGRPIRTRLGSWQVDVVSPQGVLRMYAVHVRPPTESTSGWGKELAMLERMVAADPEVDLVVGDLNATPDHEPLQQLLDRGLRSAAELANAGWMPTWPSDGQERVLGVPVPPVVQIDHVLLGTALTALGASAPSLEGTDHRAVIAELAFR